MNKKKIIVALISTMIVVSLFAGCGSSNNTAGNQGNGKTIKVGLSTDEGGINDKSFNQSADEGIKKAKNELGNVDYKAIESKKKDEYQPNLQALVDNGSDLVFGIGYQMADDLEAVAKKYPDKKFAIVDNAYDNQPKNIESLVFKEQEGSFLMGVIAARTTKTNKIGFIGGKDSELINKFAAGYIAGAKTINPSIDVKIVYIDSFADATKGEEAATTMYSQNYDVIYHAAGGAGNGLFKAAKSANTSGKKVWAIGVDQDQAVTLPEYSDVILTSMVKRVDTSTYDTVKDLSKGSFQGGKIRVFGLKEDGVGYSASTSKNVPKDVLDLVDKYKQAIIDGKINVPTTKDAANSFKTQALQ